MWYITILLALPLVSSQSAKDTQTQCKQLNNSNYYVCSGIQIKAMATAYQSQINCFDKTLDCSTQKSLKFGHQKVTTEVKILNCNLNSSINCMMEGAGANVTDLEFENILSPINEETLQGLERIQKIVIKNTDIKGSFMTEVFKLPKLTNIWCDNNGLTELPTSTVEISPLEYIGILNNNISEVPANAFGGLKLLKTLALDNDTIKVIDADAFKDLGSLENLHIVRNEITDLPPTLLQHTPRLKLLAIQFNNETLRLRSSLFTGLLNLEKVIISSYGLTVEAGLLSNLPSLRNVELRESAITNLPEDLFRNSTNINTLLLNKNNISVLPQTIFQGLKNVQKLYLSDNRLITIPKDIFNPLENLVELYLDVNLIKKLPESLFTMPNLLYISIARNELATLDQAFLGASSVKNLNLSDNKITWTCRRKMKPGQNNSASQSPLKDMFYLEKLDLSHNKLSEFCADWENMTALNYLNLSYNEIIELPEVDTKTKITVDLRNNSITSLKLGKYYKNTILLLGRNPYNCDCNIYDMIYFLRQSMNTSYHIEDAFCHQPQELKDVSVNSIAIGNIDNAKVSPSNLTCPLINPPKGCSCIIRPAVNRTECTCNNILNKTLLNTDRKNSSMHLTITSIDGIRIIPEFVSHLNISHLDLEHIPDIPKTVKQVDLTHNKLRRVPEEFLRRDLKIKLGNNPFGCECFDTEDLKILYMYRSIIQDFGTLMCDDGTHMYKIEVESLCDVYHATVIGCSLTLTGILIAVIGILFYKYSLHIKLYLFHHGWTWLIKEEMLDANKQYQIFLSYYHKDKEYVLKTLLPELDKYYNVCVHVRDFAVGENILTQIYRTVANSQRTLIVLSQAFFESKWCLEEFKAAYHQSLIDRRNRTVVILRDDVNLEKVPEDIKVYLGLSTYIKSDDSRFWERLLPALPKKLDLKDLKRREQTNQAVKKLSGLNVTYNNGKWEVFKNDVL